MKQILKRKNARKEIRSMGIKSYKSAVENSDKLRVLDRVSKSGKIFGVIFTKKDGSERVMSCRRGVKKYLKGGENSVAHLPQYVTVFDCNIKVTEKDKGYRNINLCTLKTIKGAGSVYNF